MEALEIWHYWLAIGAVFFIMEMLTPGIFAMWLGTAAFALAGLTAITDISLTFQILLFGALSALSVFLWRRYGPKEVLAETTLNRRGAEYIGQVYVLVTAIENGVGRARVGDSEWRVTGPDAAQGARVRVVAVDGATLKVEIAD